MRTFPGEDRACRAAVRLTLVGFAALAVLFTGTFPPFANPNELSRLEAVVAAADYSTFAIDRVIPRLGDHEDKSLSGGRTYSNKAPGLTLAAIPVYRLLRLAGPSPATPAAPIAVLLRLLTVSLVCLLALARFARRVAVPGGGGTPLVVAAVAFGTPYLFYARSLFAHAWTAALLFLAWDLLVRGEERRGGSRLDGLVFAAGFLAGWAAISEYAVAAVAALLFLRSAANRAWRSALAFALGAAVPIALLATYDAICFGSPFVLSSAREAYPAYSRLASTGLFGLGPPSASVGAAYLFHPARGVLLFSPFLLWAIPGFAAWWRRSPGTRADCVFALAASGLFFVLMTGYPNWHGGWSLGSRYLLPILFFPALAIPHALRTPLSRGLFACAVVWSVANHVVLTASWPHFPDTIPWPAATGSAWFLSRGWVAPSLLTGVPGGGVGALAAGVLAAAVPLALALRCAAPMSPRPVLAVLVGLLPLAALLLRPPALTFGGRLWRAAIYGAYSGRDASRRELTEVALSASTPEEKRMAMGAWRAYGRN